MIIKNVTSEPLLSEVRDIFREYQESLGFDLCFQNFEEEIDDLPGKYAPPRGRLFLAINNEEVAGCAALRPFQGEQCELKRLYVRPQYRGQKLGKLLVKKVINAAREIGYNQILLDTMPVMAKAQDLYRSLGFYETEEYRYNPIAGATYMCLDL